MYKKSLKIKRLRRKIFIKISQAVNCNILNYFNLSIKLKIDLILQLIVIFYKIVNYANRMLSLEVALYTNTNVFLKKNISINCLFLFLGYVDQLTRSKNFIWGFDKNCLVFKENLIGSYCNIITRGRGFSFKIKEWTFLTKCIRISAGAHRFFDYYCKYPVFFLVFERTKGLFFSWKKKYLIDEIARLRSFINKHSLPYKEQGVFFKNELIFIKQGKKKKKSLGSSW